MGIVEMNEELVSPKRHLSRVCVVEGSILGTYVLPLQDLSHALREKVGGGARGEGQIRNQIFFFSNILGLEILPCFFAFFKKFGSISPRIAIIVSTSRSFSSLSYIFYLLPHPSHYFSKVFLKLRLIFSLVLVEL